MKKFVFLQLFICSFSFGQVGVGTATPTGALDITSSTNGLVIPRVALTAKNVSTPVVNPNGGGAPVIGTLIWNTATAGVQPNAVVPGFYHWSGTNWVTTSVGGQTSNTYFTTGASVSGPGVGLTYLAGYPVNVVVPENCDVLLTCDVGVATTDGTASGFSSIDILLLVDGFALSDSAYQRTVVVNNGGITGAFGYASISQTVKLTAGTHSFGIGAAGTTIGSPAIIGGNGTSVLQGELTVTILKR